MEGQSFTLETVTMEMQCVNFQWFLNQIQMLLNIYSIIRSESELKVNFPNWMSTNFQTFWSFLTSNGLIWSAM